MTELLSVGDAGELSGEYGGQGVNTLPRGPSGEALCRVGHLIMLHVKKKLRDNSNVLYSTSGIKFLILPFHVKRLVFITSFIWRSRGMI